MSPPRSVVWNSTPFCCKTCSEASKCSRFPFRPWVITCGCSQSSRTSSIALAFRAATTRFCSTHASAYPIKPKSTIWQIFTSHQSLHVYLQSPHARKRIPHRFPHRRMCVHHVHHVVDGAFQVQHRRGFRQNLRRQRPDNMNPQHFAVHFVGYHFHKPAVIPQNRRLAVPHEGKLPNFHFVARVTRLLFRQSDRTDLRLAIRRIG